MVTNDILENFRFIVKTYLNGIDETRAIVIKKRFGLDEYKIETMADIGRKYGSTREWIRQIVSIATSKIKNILNGKEKFGDEKLDNYVEKCRYRFISFEHTISEYNFISLKKLEEIISRYSSSSYSDYPGYINFLMFIHGFKLTNYKFKFFYKKDHLNILRNINKIKVFMSKQIFPVSEQAIIKNFNLSKKDFDCYLSFIPEMRIIKTNQGSCYEVPIDNLHNSFSQVYRILHEKGRPMHYSEIKEELERKGCDTRVYSGILSCKYNNMSSDKIVCVTKTGMWMLNKWNIERAPFYKIITEILKEAKKPLTLKQIFEKVINVRKDAKINTVRSVLCIYKNRFDLYSDGTFGLKKWNLPNKKIRFKKMRHVPLKRDIVVKRIVDILKNYGRMSLKEVCKKLAEDYGINKFSVYYAINKNAHLFTKTEGRKFKLIELSSGF